MEKDELLVAIGKQIRKIRELKGYSQAEFAHEANLDRSFYGCIERGEKNPSATILLKIAITLNVEVGELFPEKDDIKNKVLPLIRKIYR